MGVMNLNLRLSGRLEAGSKSCFCFFLLMSLFAFGGSLARRALQCSLCSHLSILFVRWTTNKQTDKIRPSNMSDYDWNCDFHRTDCCLYCET